MKRLWWLISAFLLLVCIFANCHRPVNKQNPVEIKHNSQNPEETDSIKNEKLKLKINSTQ